MPFFHTQNYICVGGNTPGLIDMKESFIFDERKFHLVD